MIFDFGPIPYKNLHSPYDPLFSPLYGHSERGDSAYKLHPHHLTILFCNASEGFKLMNILNHEKIRETTAVGIWII